MQRLELTRADYITHVAGDSEDGDEGEESCVYTDDEVHFSDESLRELVGDFLASFVTNPDLSKGFQWSGKTQSHIQLENVNSLLRRRLASTLVNIEKSPCNLGGLLDNVFVHEQVLDRIHDLGQNADNLCNECSGARRGSPALTQRTEKLHHSVNLLQNWIDWLRHPMVPGQDGKPCNMPGAPVAKQPASPAGRHGTSALRAGSAMVSTGFQQLEESMRLVAEEKAAAADRAMEALLEGMTCANMRIVSGGVAPWKWGGSNVPRLWGMFFRCGTKHEATFMDLPHVTGVSPSVARQPSA
jgi:hypothetical protein